MTRRPLFAVLALLLLAGSASPAFAARPPFGRAALQRQLHLLQSRAAFDGIAVTDVDNDGDLDILAAPHDGGLLLWRNAGRGRFALAALPANAHALPARGPRYIVVRAVHEAWQCGDDRYDAAMPRAPAVVSAVPVSIVRVSAFVPVRPISLRPSSGRAPPLA